MMENPFLHNPLDAEYVVKCLEIRWNFRIIVLAIAFLHLTTYVLICVDLQFTVYAVESGWGYVTFGCRRLGARTFKRRRFGRRTFGALGVMNCCLMCAVLTKMKPPQIEVRLMKIIS